MCKFFNYSHFSFRSNLNSICIEFKKTGPLNPSPHVLISYLVKNLEVTFCQVALTLGNCLWISWYRNLGNFRFGSFRCFDFTHSQGEVSFISRGSSSNFFKKKTKKNYCGFVDMDLTAWHTGVQLHSSKKTQATRQTGPKLVPKIFKRPQRNG